GNVINYELYFPDGRKHIFDLEGRLEEIYLNVHQMPNEYINIVRDSNGRVQYVVSPDDRYLEYEYYSPSEDVGIPFTTNQVKRVYYKTDYPYGTNSYEVAYYEYGLKGLSLVRTGGPSSSMEYQYQYGNIDPNYDATVHTYNPSGGTALAIVSASIFGSSFNI